jgi:hypothetical protein
MNHSYTKPLAIAMWDFSWLERVWPGGGYENWELVLDELVERGYDAVRIDAFPQFVYFENLKNSWDLVPIWPQMMWGSPHRNVISDVSAQLIRFMGLCKARGLKVALSAWFRQDTEDTRMKIDTPEVFAEMWRKTLDVVHEAGLADILLYVDLCNEYPAFAPFIKSSVTVEMVSRRSETGVRWMRDSLASLRRHYPDLDYTFSISTEFDTLHEEDFSFLDFLEPHIWMDRYGDFTLRLGYDAMIANDIDKMSAAPALYAEHREHWLACIDKGIEHIRDISVKANKPLITTECWAITNYKDGPMMEWDWIKDACEHGVTRALATQRWIALSTSNFCSPQFPGMWRDKEWHLKLTDLIHSGQLPEL